MIGLESHCFRLRRTPPLEVLAFAELHGFSHVAYYTDDLLALSAPDIGRLIARAQQSTITLSATVPALQYPFQWNPDQCASHLRIAKAIGAKIVRLFIMDLGDRRAQGVVGLGRLAVHIIRSVVQLAAPLGIEVALENHGDLSCEELKSLRQSITGLKFCFDFGNQFALGESPIEAFDAVQEQLALVHIKDLAWKLIPTGEAAWRTVPLGLGGLPLKDMIALALRCIPADHLVFEVSTSGGLRRIPLQDDTANSSAFKDFCERYAHYDGAFDHYVDRSTGAIESLMQQEAEHVLMSCDWLVGQGFLRRQRTS